MSHSTYIHQGVPQGSILSPILFLLYVNQLGERCGFARVCQYADDTSMIIAGCSTSELSWECSYTTEQMLKWCDENYLRLNSTKTGLLEFRKQAVLNESLLVRLNNRSIPSIESIKFLGVHIDSSLNWEVHIKKLKNRLISICSMIRRTREVISPESMRIYYMGIVQSILNYGLMFWGGSNKADTIFITQKRILRTILGLKPRTSCKPYFLSFNILTLPSLYFLQLALFVKKNPLLFETNKDRYAADMSIVTRGQADLRTPDHSSSFYERGPLYRGIKIFHRIPKHIRNLENIKHFKTAVTDLLRDKRLYSFREVLEVNL